MKKEAKQKLEKTIKQEVGSAKKITEEFKEFIARGNTFDLAVGVVIGGAFGAITTSLVNDIIMPIVGVLIGGFDFSTLSITVGDAHIKYGSFIQTILNFLIIAACLFFMIKAVNGLHTTINSKKKKEQSNAKPAKKEEDQQIKILKEIRDELKKEK